MVKFLALEAVGGGTWNEPAKSLSEMYIVYGELTFFVQNIAPLAQVYTGGTIIPCP